MVDFEKAYGECQQRSALFNAESQSQVNNQWIDAQRQWGREALEKLNNLYNARKIKPHYRWDHIGGFWYRNESLFIDVWMPLK